MKVLFATPHGSTLYGMATPTSDHDFYRVVAKLPNIYDIRPKKYAKQDIRGLDDVLTLDFSTWTRLCEKGVPQALEAMFSNIPTVDLIADYRRSFRVGTAVMPTYLRTIRGFAEKGQHDRKFRRHALRLAFNASEMRRYGRFNPELTRWEKRYVLDLSHVIEDPDKLIDMCERIVFE